MNPLKQIIKGRHGAPEMTAGELAMNKNNLHGGGSKKIPAFMQNHRSDTGEKTYVHLAL